jgi:hypothetical protein
MNYDRVTCSFTDRFPVSFSVRVLRGWEVDFLNQLLLWHFSRANTRNLWLFRRVVRYEWGCVDLEALKSERVKNAPRVSTNLKFHFNKF